MADTAQVTRYEQVKQILDRAAAGGATDYDGKGRFWHLPLPQLLQVEIYGVRMIAPPEATASASCCHHEADTNSTNRGARSGLVQGLRGQAPFDGTQYPPLPWGGQTVPEEEIGFISDWIDDGCPAADHQISFDAEGATTKTTLEKLDRGNVETAARSFEVYEGSPNEYSYKYGELKQRPNLDCMSEPEVEKLRWAFRELYRFNKWPEDRRNYNSLALIHQNHCQHGWERFLPWHRIYLYEFEQALQDHCPNVTMPYWDWVMPEYPDNRIPNPLKMFLTGDSLKFLGTHQPIIRADKLKKLEDMLSVHFATLSSFFDEVKKRIGEEYVV